MDFNTNYKYSKAKIINEKDTDNINSDGITNKNTSESKNDDSKRKRNKNENKVNEASKKNSKKFTENNNQNASKSNENNKIKKLVEDFNRNKENEINKIKILNDKKDLEKGIIYRNITIQGENDMKVLEQDMKILKFDLLNYVNVIEYLKRNKLLRINLNLNFLNNLSQVNNTNIVYVNKTDSTKSKNHTKINHNTFKKHASMKNKTHLENKIKDFIAEKIINKTLNISNIHKIRNKEIKVIVSDFHDKDIKSLNKTIVNKINNNFSSFNNRNFVIRKNLIKTKKINKNLNTTELLYRNLDKVSERLTLMFKKVLKDIVLNPSDYILEGKLENNLSFMKEEIKNSLSESIQIPVKDKIISITKSENKNHNEMSKKINELADSKSLNKTKKIVVEVVKNFTKNLFNKSNEINFIQSKIVENPKKNSINSKSTNKNVTDITKNEIINLISKKMDNNNKIQFVLKKSYSKKIAVELQTNYSIPVESKAHKNNKLTELDHKVNKHIKDNFPTLKKPIQNEKKIIANKTKVEKHSTNALPVKNQPKIESMNTEKANLHKKLESQKNSILELQKKIFSQLPEMKQTHEKKKLNESTQKESFKNLNKSSGLKKNHKTVANINKKNEVRKSVLVTNNTLITSNLTKVLKQEIRKNKKDKLAESSSNLRKDINKVLDNANSNNKNTISSNSEENQNKKNLGSIFSQDLNNFNKKIQNKKVEMKHEDLEIDDGSVMAEILKAYKNKFKSRKD